MKTLIRLFACFVPSLLHYLSAPYLRFIFQQHPTEIRMEKNVGLRNFTFSCSSLWRQCNNNCFTEPDVLKHATKIELIQLGLLYLGTIPTFHSNQPLKTEETEKCGRISFVCFGKMRFESLPFLSGINVKSYEWKTKSISRWDKFTACNSS